MDIAELLTLAFEHHASDLHLSAGAVPMIRVDGDMQQLIFQYLKIRRLHTSFIIL